MEVEATEQPSVSHDLDHQASGLELMSTDPVVKVPVARASSSRCLGHCLAARSRFPGCTTKPNHHHDPYSILLFHSIPFCHRSYNRMSPSHKACSSVYPILPPRLCCVTNPAPTRSSMVAWMPSWGCGISTMHLWAKTRTTTSTTAASRSASPATKPSSRVRVLVHRPLTPHSHALQTLPRKLCAPLRRANEAAQSLHCRTSQEPATGSGYSRSMGPQFRPMGGSAD
ncbi:hypothetical protein EDB86DRAFT_1499597 [Lactarius hatsudake]|nr:hypothetical protein EDB86DRAFT_1499597 [Lactarius hatsudake]